MDKVFKWHLFFTSFIPLWISIMIIDCWKICEWWVNIDKTFTLNKNLYSFFKENFLLLGTLVLLIILLLSSIISLNKFIKDKKLKNNNPKCKIIEAKHNNHLTSDFILSYILPMIAFDFTDLLNIVLFILYFTILAFICIRNNNIYINVYLEIRKYKMYICNIECTRANEKVQYSDCLVISRNNLEAEIDQDKEYWDFANKIYIDLTSKE